MVNSPRESFSEYVMERGIRIINSKEKKELTIKINEEHIINQLCLMSEFHSKVMGYDNYIGHKLEDKRGKTVEEYKIYIKKIRREFEVVKKKSALNSFEKLFLQCAEGYLDKAQNCIDEIYENDYLELIRRSMNRVEVCLGDTYFTNLNKRDQMEIVNLQGCCYDMVELDAVYFLAKIKKKFNILSLEELINKFCEFENLSLKSQKFIEALLLYPYEFMKCCMRYKKNNGYLKEEKYRTKLEKIVVDDKNFIL
ncbi:spore coat protein [Clostridium sp. ZS2-4]|uniref:spore coat protein n=1 Tax=Clostridium sp. ZS2-4 TaxID=2987703 RepID=UPI00227AAFF2|nr:spore coat protein [Clostridium sp. ZS2-4]MCY6355533.1 spore coat protein [Clostridium sp. ZS2-4]